MNLQLPIDIPRLEPGIALGDSIYLCGSCFTANMVGYFERHKFSVKQNSHGIIFNPMSVYHALIDVVEGKVYQESDLFYLNEYWHSWYHHSDFSFLEKEQTLEKINTTIQAHRTFLKECSFLFITLGSAFAYWQVDEQMYVSNNHRAPANWFRKDLLPIDTITAQLQRMQESLHQFNPKLNIIYTISPVRHVRDGVIENNRSKARLLEAVHSLPNRYYFPSYELVLDVLRDYRFYDIDLVHPNYLATQLVWEHLVQACIQPAAYPVMKQLEQVYKARHHEAKDVRSKAHTAFLEQHYALCLQLQAEYPALNFKEELDYFNTHSTE